MAAFLLVATVILFVATGNVIAFSAVRPITHGLLGLRSSQFHPISERNEFKAVFGNLGARRSLLPPLRVFFKNKWDDPDYDPTKQEIDTKVPLHIAAFKGDVEEVKRLLAAGADVNEANESGWTAIQWAARGAGKGQESPRAVEVCRILKEAGADILSINLTGNTALHHAAHWGDPAVTDLLISWYTPEQVPPCPATSPQHNALRAHAQQFRNLPLPLSSPPSPARARPRD